MRRIHLWETVFVPFSMSPCPLYFLQTGTWVRGFHGTQIHFLWSLQMFSFTCGQEGSAVSFLLMFAPVCAECRSPCIFNHFYCLKFISSIALGSLVLPKWCFGALSTCISIFLGFKICGSLVFWRILSFSFLICTSAAKNMIVYIWFFLGEVSHYFCLDSQLMFLWS